MPTPDASARDSLTAYLDGAGVYERLGAEQELARAREMVQLRRAWWIAALRLGGGEPLRKLVKAALGSEGPRLPAGEASDILVDALMAIDHDGGMRRRLESVTSTRESRGLRRARLAYTRCRNAFLCSNLRLVVLVAKKYGRQHMPLSDRVQEGNVGLLQAVERFDPERGCRFSTYAAWWIRHGVTRALVQHSRTVRIPSHLHALFIRARKQRASMQRELGRAPTLDEVADALDVRPSRLESAFAAMALRAVGLEAPIGNSDGSTIADSLADDKLQDWSDRVGERIDARLVASVVEDLVELDRDVIVRRFGLGGETRRTLRFLGEDYGLSRERVRQLQCRALGRMRDAIEVSELTSIQA